MLVSAGKREILWRKPPIAGEVVCRGAGGSRSPVTEGQRRVPSAEAQRSCSSAALIYIKVKNSLVVSILANNLPRQF